MTATTVTITTVARRSVPAGAEREIAANPGSRRRATVGWMEKPGCRWSGLRCAVVALALGCGGIASAGAEPTQPPEKPGLRCIGSTYFPVPDGTTPVPLPGGDFETGGKVPAGWALGGGQSVTADDAPQGKSYPQFPARKGTILITPRDLDLPGGQPYFFSLWLKCPEDHWTCIGFRCDESLRTIGDHYPGIPGTNNHWKRVGYYVWMPTQAKGLHLQIQPHKDSPEGQFIAVDDVRLRTATAAEMSAAYEADRQALPPYDATPRPDDGRQLALSVAKWEGRVGLPGKPFVIWAVGSSWTNFQGDGYPLIRAIRERFPTAPPIVYKKHAGSGTPWDFARGWVQQMVIPEQPDLVFTYIQPKPKSYPRKLQGPGPGDIAPHAVTLGEKVMPQAWTITMTSDNGDYQLTGSITGPDGEGQVTRPFTSRSGQIQIDPALWRNGRVERRDDKGQVTEVLFGNRAGDAFTFDVYRCAAGEVSFRCAETGRLSLPLVQNLPNACHTLELVASGNGEIAIEGLYVFEPPLK